ncbi:MAG: class I mannose-6-phosphate isomerase, partial [Fusobacteriaceae bacterium]
MKFRKTNYEKNPHVMVNKNSDDAWSGYENILKALDKKKSKKNVFAFDYYHGVNEKEVFENLITKLNFDKVIDFSLVKKSEEEIQKIIKRNLTDDRVFGVLSNYLDIKEFFDEKKLEKTKKEISEIQSGNVLVYGVGASMIKFDTLVYFDMARWEIQMRYRDGLDNWGAKNFDEDILKKYKRSFFIEWRIFDNHKKGLFDKIDFLVDTNIKNNPNMITGENFRFGLEQAVKNPIRLVPFFDPGIWGGQWMKEVCDLDKDKKNYAWCFDCVPEENSLKLKYGDIIIEIPSINLVFYKAKELLGDKVHARFGEEFPIRFDFLDTMGGQHLSLQVHPLTEYIQEKFGMHYTQDESYYMLDVEEDAKVYL